MAASGSACSSWRWVAKVGYGILPFALVWNLIWAPWLGTVMGLTHSRTRRPGLRPWPQLRTRTLMAVVAYVALLLGSASQGDCARMGNLRHLIPGGP
ncbi:hypothetical protein [Singulisphaera acidiphila]|uniref:Uncharacterized protein n=1 Tax=Singulisphaera acidiphila (strain ATCC BAA-1392 / DSM 18658 / VKM B-2454 / MOB10) TaxID=886293 RepID=L0D6K5_SINAD|nr:hypothetical protein [Singulisphaera acidiphila]AGA25039.1 hypothetical protein Sinac_0624 [Singulisphaera acidiphila DSM 18658]